VSTSDSEPILRIVTDEDSTTFIDAPEAHPDDWGGQTPGQYQHEATDAGRGFVWLDELASLPFMTEAPAVVIPHIALSGRLTLFAAEEKSGKSTLIGQAVAALSSGGTFLGTPSIAGRAMWMGLDEPTSDCARRLIDNGACQSKIALVEEKPSWNDFYDMLDLVQPRVLVIDTLSECASDEVPDFNSAASWTPVLKKLRTTICRQRNIAIVLLHHTKKGSHGYADSRAVGAGVDIILEMYGAADGDANRRIVAYRGRGLGAGTYRIRYTNGQYSMEASACNR
jgi:RecA-family ATPase